MIQLLDLVQGRDFIYSPPGEDGTEADSVNDGFQSLSQHAVERSFLNNGIGEDTWQCGDCEHQPTDAGGSAKVAGSGLVQKDRHRVGSQRRGHQGIGVDTKGSSSFLAFKEFLLGVRLTGLLAGSTNHGCSHNEAVHVRECSANSNGAIIIISFIPIGRSAILTLV
jgi:hypothetical protein